MNWLRTAAALTILAVLAALVWLALYAYDSGFSNKWRRLVRKELEKHHLVVDFETLTLDPLQGLVANDVILYQDATKERVMARISRVRLDIDLPKLMREEPFLERIELRDASLSLPFDSSDPESERLELDRLSANILLPNERMEISEAEADFHGLRVSLKGSLIRPTSEKKEGSWTGLSERDAVRAQWVYENLVEHLGRLQVPRGAAQPHLAVNVVGDLSRIESLRADVTLVAHEFLYDGLPFSAASLLGAVSATDFDLKRFVLDDGTGQFRLSGTFPFNEPQAEIDIESNLDLARWLERVPLVQEWTKGLAFSERPLFRLSGKVSLDESFFSRNPPVDLVGSFESGPFMIGQEPFENLKGDFHLQGPRLLGRNLELKHASGVSSGKFFRDTDEALRYEAELGMDPSAWQAFSLPQNFKRILDRWEFEENSKVILTIKGQREGLNRSTWEHEGTLNLSRCTFEGAPLNYLMTKFSLNAQIYHFSDFRMQLLPNELEGDVGGLVEGDGLTISVPTGITRFHNVRGTVHPAQVVRCFSPKIGEVLDAYHFDTPPKSVFVGVIDPRDWSKTNLVVDIEAPGTMSFEFLGKTLPLEKPKGRLRFFDKNMVISQVAAGLFGGRITGNLNMTDLPGDRVYSADLDLREVLFQQLSAVYFPDRPSDDGDLTGRFNWSGEGVRLASIYGNGAAHLVNGDSLAVPVLGPLSFLISKALGPTDVTHETVNDLNGSFSMKDGILTFESVQADMEAFEVNGDGYINLLDDSLRFEVALTNKGPASLLLNVLYSVLGKYTCTGTLDEPKWALTTPGDQVAQESGDKGVEEEDEELEEFDPRTLLPDQAEKFLRSLLQGNRSDDESDE